MNSKLYYNQTILLNFEQINPQDKIILPGSAKGIDPAKSSLTVKLDFQPNKYYNVVFRMCKKNKKTVAIAMSGGVDSSVAAALLKNQDFKIIGVFMEVYTDSILESEVMHHACFGPNGYALENKKNPQFEVQDNRSVREIISMIKKKGYDPVFTDWRRIENSFG